MPTLLRLGRAAEEIIEREALDRPELHGSLDKNSASHLMGRTNEPLPAERERSAKVPAGLRASVLYRETGQAVRGVLTSSSPGAGAKCAQVKRSEFCSISFRHHCGWMGRLRFKSVEWKRGQVGWLRLHYTKINQVALLMTEVIKHHWPFQQRSHDHQRRIHQRNQIDSNTDNTIFSHHKQPHGKTNTDNTIFSHHKQPHGKTNTDNTIFSHHKQPHGKTNTDNTIFSHHKQPHGKTNTDNTIFSHHKQPHGKTNTDNTIFSPHEQPHGKTNTDNTIFSPHEQPHGRL
ncbi:hypothetical protein RRG08_022495 [Elysia crispata]|uniref:Uncharacterized protein n=1 Tax=Elysia crispata TaxID=231223 RepID=A0AAE0Z2I6_9GAST|nr:hypothetical protein RRG08_022495 [Elysia crispata]